jgi:transcriptional regulator with XRE-family HTH domain
VQTSFVRDEEIYRMLGLRIAARRRELKLTQAVLAEKVRMSRASIANIEGGRQNVLLHQVYRFSEALKMSEASELLPPAGSSQSNSALVGVSFSDENIGETDKAMMSQLLSMARSQRKAKS